MLDSPLALSEKRRVGNDDAAQVLQLIGDVKGQDALIIDDEVDTAGTLTEVAGLLADRGARHVYGAATHGVFSGPAMERIAASPIEQLVVTDTLPHPPEKRGPKISVISVAPLLGEAIRRIHSGQSVGALFR